MSREVHVPFCERPRMRFPRSTHLSWLPGPAKGTWYYLYLVLDIYDRFTVHAEVFETENADNAKRFIEQACWREHKIKQAPIVLHSDNGSPMKASTFQEKMLSLGLVSSYSRPRVSNDNPYSESLFKTLNTYRLSPTRALAASKRRDNGCSALCSGTTKSTVTAP